MLALLDDVRSVESKIEALSDLRRPQFEKRGQLHPRDRVALLVDRGGPFVELSSLVGLGMHGDDGGDNATGGATITGIGLVSGVRCVVMAHDSGIKGAPLRRWECASNCVPRQSPWRTNYPSSIS